MSCSSLITTNGLSAPSCAVDIYPLGSKQTIDLLPRNPQISLGLCENFCTLCLSRDVVGCPKSKHIRASG